MKIDKINKKNKSGKIKMMIIFILLACILPGFDQRLKIQYYTIESEQITEPVRIVLVTDLHACQYGENQQELIQAVQEQNPDLIALSGDIFDENMPDANTEYFLQDIAQDYPCYYVTGNHEYYVSSELQAKRVQFLESLGIKILSGTEEACKVHGQNLTIYGIEDPSGGLVSEKQLQNVKELSKNNPDNPDFKILLSHRPELFETYCTGDFNLVLCGHAHGGQWRIPFLVNGLYAPHQGFFPEHAGGLYQDSFTATTMIVSRGLARESTRIPRFYNRPELVVIDLN
ncbi:MAG: metallophosphoesterase [Oscillospiraceae bacterium]|nr:metallophosphoesterase [Oscillospiraceae bacterium]